MASSEIARTLRRSSRSGVKNAAEYRSGGRITSSTRSGSSSTSGMPGITARPTPPTTSRIGYGIRVTWAAISKRVTAARIESSASSVDIALVVAERVAGIRPAVRTIEVMDATVTDNPAEHRYEVHSDGALAGFAVYHLRSGRISFVHTEIDDRFEGEGLGSRLISAALDDVRRRDLGLLPFCPFVNGWLKRHPDYVDLVPESERERFGL